MKYTLTKANLGKIARGAGIAAGGAAALGLLEYLGTIEIDNPTLAMVITGITPVLINTIRQFLKDE